MTAFVTKHAPNEAPQTGTRVVDCPNCGKAYARSNFMLRYAVDEAGRVRYTDVHVAACYGWEVLKPTDERHPFPKHRRRR